jgi:MoaA/NifB/PqqE/SkfB family radical SAM enzyme
MNVLINGKCSKNCRFCFETAYFRNQPNMSVEMFTDILNWHLKSEMQPDSRVPLSILGGEPTIHPQFNEILDVIIERQRATNRIFELQLVTNGDRLKDYVHKLPQIKFAGLLLNISAMGSDAEIREKLQVLKNNNIYTVPSLTVSNSSILDKLHLICGEFDHIKLVRVGFSSSSEQKAFSYFQENRGYLLEAFRFLTQHKKVISMDCTKIPLCAFTAEERKELHNFIVLINSGNWFGAACPTACADIMPDGSIVHCVPLYDLTTRELKYHHFDNYYQVFDYTNRMISDRIEKKMSKSETCRACIEYKTARCFAGCLGMDAVP